MLSFTLEALQQTTSEETTPRISAYSGAILMRVHTTLPNLEVKVRCRRDDAVENLSLKL